MPAWLTRFLGSSLVSVFGNAILKPVLSHLDAKAAANRDIVVAQTGSDERRDIALVQGQIEANKLKAAAQPQFRVLIYLIALPPALQAAAVYLDSFPWWTPWGPHVVGGWGVPVPPAPFDAYQREILLSFFIMAPVVQAVRVGAAAIARR